MATQSSTNLSATKSEFLYNSQQFLLDIRLSAIQECIKRTRVALILGAFASLASLICVWNTAFSVDRISTFRVRPLEITREQVCEPARAPIVEDKPTVTASPSVAVMHATPPPKSTVPCIVGDAPTLYGKLAEAFAAKWIESTYITIPILGVTISVMDFSIFNSCAMVFFSIYFLLSVRRENREVCSLLVDLRQGMYIEHLKDDPVKRSVVLRTVYRAVCSFMIFNVPQHNDEPITRLERTKSSDSQRAEQWFEQTGKLIYNFWLFFLHPLGKYRWYRGAVSSLQWAFRKLRRYWKRFARRRTKGFRRRAQIGASILLELFLLRRIWKFGRASRFAFRREQFHARREANKPLEQRSKAHPAEVVFFLRKGIFFIFALPVLCLFVNLAFHIELIFASPFLWHGLRLRAIVILVEMIELISLRYVIHLAGWSQRFHWATNYVISMFRDYFTCLGKSDGQSGPCGDIVEPPVTPGPVTPGEPRNNPPLTAQATV
jgi:hypothetical protein